MKLKFIIKKYEELDLWERKIVQEYYYNYYNELYGTLIFSSFFAVTKVSNDELKENVLKKITKGKKIILLSNSNNTIEGCGIINELTLEDIIIRNDDKEKWFSLVNFVEEYFLQKRYKKMYLKIPTKFSFHLLRASELGFKEDEKDINNSREYILNKVLKEEVNE